MQGWNFRCFEVWKIRSLIFLFWLEDCSLLSGVSRSIVPCAVEQNYKNLHLKPIRLLHVPRPMINWSVNIQLSDSANAYFDFYGE